MVFVPFHWGDLFGEGNAANYLTISAIGRVAKQPELKFCAVNLEKVRSGVRSQESGVKIQESGVRSQESGVSSQESVVSSQ
jgi:hypothetical protein